MPDEGKAPVLGGNEELTQAGFGRMTWSVDQMRYETLTKAEEDPTGTAALLLDAAEEVFAEHGYGAASTREIARRAGVPFGALHYHWGSKQQLRQAVHARAIERFKDTIGRGLAVGHTGGAAIDTLVDAFVDLLIANRNLVRLLYRSTIEPLDKTIEAMIIEFWRFGLGVFQRLGIELPLDNPASLLVISHLFVACVVDEPGQRLALGDSVFHSPNARDRLCVELRRVARMVFQVKE